MKKKYAAGHENTAGSAFNLLFILLKPQCNRRRPRLPSTLLLHVPAVLPADFVETVRDLSQRADFDRFHQFREHVSVPGGDLLEPSHCGGGFVPMGGLKRTYRLDLLPLLLLGRAYQLDRARRPPPLTIRP